MMKPDSNWVTRVVSASKQTVDAVEVNCSTRLRETTSQLIPFQRVISQNLRNPNVTNVETAIIIVICQAEIPHNPSENGKSDNAPAILLTKIPHQVIWSFGTNTKKITTGNIILDLVLRRIFPT